MPLLAKSQKLEQKSQKLEQKLKLPQSPFTKAKAIEVPHLSPDQWLRMR
jgi:sarcosine oxidase gamma subunit